MKSTKHLKPPVALTGIALLASLALFPSCGGGGGGGTGSSGPGGAAALLKVEYGRLVDIYAYRRVDSARADRRDIMNRTPVLISKDVVVSTNLESQPLFDAIGNERIDADYRFLPFDVQVGHEELLILWDDRVESESARFSAAVLKATSFLNEVASAYRDQNTVTKPIPVVPRNAALQLTFDRPLSQGTDFFVANPSAVQVLEFKADPKVVNPVLAFKPVTTRLIASGNKLIVDTTLIGAEAQGSQPTAGLPMSSDNVTANMRLALPTEGATSRLFKVAADGVATQNGMDSRAQTAVIRDFRSGNLNDGRVGALVDSESPVIVGHIGMGIIEIDAAARVVTLNKRYSRVAIRGRAPFVDGALAADTGMPLGPAKVPTDQPLRSGDYLYQDVRANDGRILRLRAEILQVMNVGTVTGDTNLPLLGLTANAADGGDLPVESVRVASLTTFDPVTGVDYSFQADSANPTGKDCVVRVHYYENVPYNTNFGNATVTDSGRRGEFLIIDPAPPVLDASRNPIPRGEQVDPQAAIGVRFSEPMDLAAIDPLNNYFLSNKNFTDANVLTYLANAKACSVSVLAARLFDQESNGTVLRLKPPYGFYHESTKVEENWFHMVLGSNGAKDLSGNPVDVYDRRIANVQTVSFKIKLAPEAVDNWVGSRIYRFEALDEDGTPPGSIDLFGQYRLQDGKLMGASTTRFSGTADNQNLGGILRGDKGECYNATTNTNVTGPGPLPLYQTPSMLAVQLQPPIVYQPPQGPQLFGGIVEPHQPRGARLQMTYHEDDFGLAYHDPNQMLIDIEQMYWAEWNANPALFDTFDRVTLSMGHSDWRPDIRVWLIPGMPPTCNILCDSLKSGLRPSFDDNVLEGTSLVDVTKDAIYSINPNMSLKGASGTTFTPWPKFANSFTWRDPRLVTWSTASNKAVGLGGAHNPNQLGGNPARDLTCNVSSPFVPDKPQLPQYLQFVTDDADFWGDRPRDFDPIALPLLMQFKVYPDGQTNGVASGANQFHIGYIGPIWPGNPIVGCGYYNSLTFGACLNLDYPQMRAYTIGGFDPQKSQDIYVNPDETYTAQGGWIKDMGLGDPTRGLVHTKYGDDHIHWAQADFVRKISMATAGFIDTLKPNQSKNLTGFDPNGSPDFAALQTTLGTTLRIKDFLTVTDPPITAQPAGTNVTFEFRTATTFDYSNVIYDKVANDTVPKPPVVLPVVGRGNIMNPYYACEAYRYATPNSGDTFSAPRVSATGLTPYVPEETLDSLRDATKGYLPQFLNWRVILQNNTAVNPATSPGLRSFSLVYRMARYD